MQESWKEIEGYEGLYMVSDAGRVKSLRRRSGASEDIRCRGKILKPIYNGKGYQYVILCNNKDRQQVSVHRLVASAFVDNPSGKTEVNHKDFNRENNHFDNLEWLTHKENVRHSSRNYAKSKTGALRERKTNTGEHHISASRNNMFKVAFSIKKNEYRKYFKNLDDAIAYRDWFIEANYANGRANNEIATCSDDCS